MISNKTNEKRFKYLRQHFVGTHLNSTILRVQTSINF